MNFAFLLASLIVSTVLSDFIHQPAASLPWLGLGTAALRGEAENLIFAALEYGLRLIDTAQAKEWYDEQTVGKAVQRFEEQYTHRLQVGQENITVVTKIHPRSYSYRDMDEKLAESSRYFGSHGLDVVLLHAPFCWHGHCSKQQEQITWRMGFKNLELLQQKYHIKYIGVSNFNHFQLHELLTNVASHPSKVNILQNWMDPFHQDREVRILCNEYHIQYMAYSSFGTQWEYSHNGKNPIWENVVLQELALQYQVSIPMLILSWLWHEQVVAIPRSTNLYHLQENFQLHFCHDHKDLCHERGWLVAEEETITKYPIPFTEEDLLALRALDGSLGVL